MRWLLVAFGLIAPIGGAFAQEYELPTLRGSDSFLPAAGNCCPQWGGFYAGGQLGYGFASVDFAQSTQPLIAHMLRELALLNVVSSWEVLGNATARGSSYGGFIGYNTRWEGLILGFELNYSRAGFSTDAPISPIRRITFAEGNTY